MSSGDRQYHSHDHFLVAPLRMGGTAPRVVVKDCIDIAGTVTGCGSRVLADGNPAEANAIVVDRLLAGGAAIVGKANMHEFAYGVTGINQWHGTPANPRYPGRIPGGSSSGSAVAVAAGFADIGIGTDTGGSIRVPAACCGIYGLKPTFGRIARNGTKPEKSTLDCVGPLARDMAKLEMAMELIDPSFTPAERPDCIRLGHLQVWAEQTVAQAFEAALAVAADELLAITLPSFAEAYEAGIILIARENFDAIGRFLEHPRLGGDVRERLRAAGEVSDERVAWAEFVRVRFALEVDQALSAVDALALPTMPIVPPMIADAADGQAALRITELTRPFNLSGHPALSIPLQGEPGLPIGFQIVAARGNDPALCSIAAVIAGRIERL